jgi:hypothetical protein
MHIQSHVLHDMHIQSHVLPLTRVRCPGAARPLLRDIAGIVIKGSRTSIERRGET